MLPVTEDNKNAGELRNKYNVTTVIFHEPTNQWYLCNKLINAEFEMVGQKENETLTMDEHTGKLDKENTEKKVE